MKEHTILVVEDNPITSKMVRVTLETHGCKVFEAGTGHDALDALQLCKPSLVILDLLLPDADGIELLACMRDIPAGRHIPILAFSGLQSRMEQARLMRASFTDYLFKPVEPSRLIEIVSTHLRSTQTNRKAFAHGELLLLVDDDPGQCKLNAIQLRELGFEVVTAADALEALEVSHFRRPDIVVTDLIMPGMTGIELCCAIRRDPSLAEVPVIITSSTFAHIDDEDRAMARRMGANAFVTRTPTLREVIDAVKANLGEAGHPPVTDAESAGKEYVRRLIHQLQRQGITNQALLRRGAVDSALLAVLTATATALSQNADLGSVMREALARILDASGLSAGAIFVRNSEGGLEPMAVLGGPGIEVASLSRFFSAGDLLHELAGRDSPVRIHGEAIAAAADDRTVTVPLDKWLVVAPIIVEGNALGVIVTCSADPVMSEEWVNSAQTVGSQIGMAIALSKTLESLRASEGVVRERDQQFRELAENISDVFYVMDAQFRETLYINPAYEKIFGRTCATLYENPSSFLEPVHPDDLPGLKANMAQVQQGMDAGDVDFRVILPDGSERWILSHAIPIRNKAGDVVRICGVAKDITERRRTQAALEESATRYRLLNEASFDAIAITQDGVVREVNRGFLSTFGYDAEVEVIGRPPTDFVGAESHAEVSNRVGKNIEGTYDVVGKRKDGKGIFLEVTAKAHTIDGKAARVTALRDVTERRSLEAQFRQAQKMEAVGRLAGGVAHDFNNLLTVIMGNAEILQSELMAGDPRADELGQIREAADGAAALTRQLLAFSRQQVVEPRTVVLEDVIERTKKMLSQLIGEDVEVATSFTPERCKVHIDPGQLEQVIMNLAVNARDAMPTGGKLTIETSIVELGDEFAQTHWPATPGRFALLAVSDNGTGMNAATRDRIFEPFFTTKEQGKGTGLGLATVYGIVKQSGGSIAVYSEPGMGTTFKVYLPLTDDAPVAEIDAANIRPAPTGTETILLVEDSASVRDVARKVLQKQGYVVLESGSAIDALVIAKRRNVMIDVLLTDVVMPQMSGRVLAERFVELHPQAKILYMSGYTDDAIVRHGVLNAGMSYIQKPFTPRGLGFKIREVLDAN